MTRVYLVRHGRAAAGWDTDVDPGLDDLGRSQADEVAATLGPLGPLAVVSSPLRRCRETAVPLSGAWRRPLMIDDRFREIPSPAGVPMDQRVTWLRAAMAGTWADLGDPFVTFRNSVIDGLRSLATPTVVFSHFIAINAVVGVATGDDRLVIHHLDNCSITVVDVADDGSLTIVETGREADTLIR